MSSGATPLTSPTTLAGRLWPSRDDSRLGAIRAVALMALGTALLAVSAKIQVPFPYVPMTMQTLVVLLIGAAYGWRLGGATILLYLVEGALGLPVFAGPVAGPAYMAGPTGGFLLGFLAAAVVTGFMAEHGWNRSALRILAMMTAGHVVLFAFGLAWLCSLMPLGAAWAAGVAPFVAATILKTALAAAIMQAAWAVTRSSDTPR
jgi:biotin transport system substrate-specific component